MAAPDTHHPERRAWATVAVLTLAYIFSYVDRTILSLMVGPIKADLGISDTGFSLLVGLAFALFYTVLGIPIARLADRTNRRNLMAGGVALWSLMTVACGLAGNYVQLFLARVGVGVGEAALTPAAYSTLADLFSRERLGRAMGVYGSGVFIGTGLSFIGGGMLVELITESGAPFGLKPWQATFMLAGLPGLGVAALFLLLKEPPRVAVAREHSSFKAATQFILKHRAAYGFHFIGFALQAMMFNAIVTWAAEYLIRIHGMARTDAGLQLGLVILIFGGAGIISGGLLSDRLMARGHRDAPIRAALIGLVPAVPLAVAACLAPDAGLAVLLFCPLLFCISLPFGPASTALQLISPAPIRAQVSSVYLLVVNAAGIGFGGTLTALLGDYLFADPMQLGKSMALAGAGAGILSILAIAKARKPVSVM